MKQFITQYKLQIFSVLIISLLALLVGHAQGMFLNYRRLMSLRTQKQKHQYQITELSKELASTKHALTLRESAQKTTNAVHSTVQYQFQRMASEAHAFNVVTSKLIAKEGINNENIKRIYQITQESNAILRCIFTGYPLKAIEENIDVAQFVEKIKVVYLPEIFERNVRIKIKNKPKSNAYIDKANLELVLHNVFHLILKRFNQNNRLLIEIKDEDPLQILFQDDGYEVDEHIQKINAGLSAANSLALTKKQLQEYIGILGWEISFKRGRKGWNVVNLSIPHSFKEKDLPANVVNLLDYKGHS